MFSTRVPLRLQSARLDGMRFFATMTFEMVLHIVPLSHGIRHDYMPPLDITPFP